MEKKRCKAKSSQTGQPCKNPPVKGATVCWKHGGKAPQVKAAAAARQAEARVRKLADRYVRDAVAVDEPLTALLRLAGEMTAFKDFVGDRVAELRAESWRYEGEHAEQLRAEVGLYERALDRTARVLVDINRLDLEGRVLALYERVAGSYVQVLEGVLDDLELTPGQRARAPMVVQARLRAITGGGGGS